MNKTLVVALSILTLGALSACQPKTDQTSKEEVSKDMSASSITYPETAKGNVVDTYFGIDVEDPYRWLEDDMSQQTGEWIEKQNQLTQGFLNKIKYREKIESIVRDLINYERVSAPFTEGKYTYFYKNDGLQNQSVVFRQLEQEEPEVFIDPNTFSEDGTVSLAGMSFSKDGSLVAYMTSTGGSDWRQVYIMDTNTMEFIGQPLQDVKFSGLSWYKNEGFYYSSYYKPEGSQSVYLIC